MYCEQCQKNAATIHYTKIVNGQKLERHLCEQCAREMKEPMMGLTALGLTPDFSMADFIGSFFYHGMQGTENQQQPLAEGNPCPACGMTVNEFKKLGRVGCGSCYDHFGQYMPGVV